MKGSAQLGQLALDQTGDTLPEIQPEAVPVRQAAAERLAAHRERRARLQPQSGAGDANAGTPARGRSRKDQIAAAVAERYAQTPSYRAFLAEEAQRAAQQAAAAAEIAARNAEAAHAVQEELLAELELWTAPQEFSGETAALVTASEPAVSAEAPPPGTARPSARSRAPKVAAKAPSHEAPVAQVSAAGLTVRLYEDAGLIDSAALQRAPASPSAPGHSPLSEEEARVLEELEEEIAFRQSPVFDEFSIDPPTPLPANLLEFPRQLVAAKKARPRLAEGPLREDAPRSPQLRIFEVEPEQISNTPAPVPAAPEWTTIRLDAHPAADPGVAPTASYSAAPGSTVPVLAPLPSMTRIEVAPVSLRLMATLVDLGLVSFAFLGCVAACARLMDWIPTGGEALTAAAVTLLVLYGGYTLLFFTLSDQTPGMRYARIGLCTFDDENPTRAAMRKRLLAQVIAAIPLGIGLLWALLDDEGLGWHDRMSRMYQRAY